MGARQAAVVVLAGAIAVLAALALGGCSLGGPRAPAPSTRASASTTTPAAHGSGRRSGGGGGRRSRSGGGSVATRLAQAQRTHEYPTPTPPQAVVGGWRSPARAVEVFAATYINWSAATVAARLSGLAQVAVGQARSALRMAATQAARDGELRRGGIANSGTVEAIGPVAGHARQYAVVTRERTTAARGDAYQGLAPEWHVAVATVTRVRDGLWVLSGWQPES